MSADATEWVAGTFALLGLCALGIGVAIRLHDRLWPRPADPPAPSDLSDEDERNVGQPEAHKRTETEDSGSARAPTPSRWRGLLRWRSEPSWVELTVGLDSPSEAFTLRRCDACGRYVWVWANRAIAARVVCRSCLLRIAAPPAPPAPKPSAAPKAPTRPATPPATTPATPAPSPPKRDRNAERAAQIREWNEEHEHNVEDDVAGTMRLGIPRREGESDVDYRARLKRRAATWTEGRSALVSPPTPVGATPSLAEPRASRRTARKVGRKKS